MTKADGYIEVTVHYAALGGVERRDYRWIGGDIANFPISYLSDNDPSVTWYALPPYKPGDRLRIGPFKLRILERERGWRFDEFLVIRERGLVTDLRLFWHRFGKLLDVAYRRAVITLAVWRLAERNEGAIPTWRDVHAPRRVADWWRRMQQMEVRPSVVWNGWMLSRKQADDLERIAEKERKTQ